MAAEFADECASWPTGRGNSIVNVAPDAFADLTSLQLTPTEFEAQYRNWTDLHGIGLWPHGAGETYFGNYSGNQSWANLPMALSPNFVKCRWVGPNVNDFNCSSCALGYETASDSNVTCVQPEFKPYTGWAADLTQNPLRLQDEHGSNAAHDESTNTATLRAGRTYTIKAPALYPKDTKFAGYAQPYRKIRYELDFSRGAAVDIGCGTSVVGDTTEDGPTNKTYFAHPNSCREISFQYEEGRGNLKDDPPDLGYYPEKCQRYHRFNVTRPGNFTFVRARSSCTSTLIQPVGKCPFCLSKDPRILLRFTQAR